MAETRKLIAFMGGMLDEEKNSNFIHAVEQECLNNGYLMLAFGMAETTIFKQDRNNCDLKLVEIAGQLDLHAIIMQLEFIKNKYLVEAIRELGRKKNIPIIVMERHLPGSISIAMRYDDGFGDTVRHVIDVHGCRKIYMIAGPKGDYFSEERIKAFKKVLDEKGIPFDPKKIGYGDFWYKPAKAAVREFVESGDIPEAFVCANDAMAIAVCDEVERLGYRGPVDIIVTGFDGIRSGLFNNPSITTVEPDYASEAKKVIELIKDNECTPEIEVSYDVDFVLKRRKSCGCVKTGEMIPAEEITDLSTSYDDVNWAVRSINMLVSRAGMLDTMSDLATAIVDTLWLQEDGFEFVGVFSDLLRPEMENIGNCDFTTLFRYEDNIRSGIGESYDEKEFLRGIDRILQSVDIGILLVRLLYSGDKTFGYVVEGTKNIGNRDIRRCEEFSMFLSTAINAVLTNRDLTDMRREMEKISVLDYLTGIYNRRGFTIDLKKRVGMLPNRGKYLYAFSIDMDNLKYINDFFGHLQGDFAIQSMASAIQELAGNRGICARYGGDEFVCAMITEDDIELSPDFIRGRLRKILMSKPEVASKPYTITASIGVKRTIIDDSLNISKLISEADEMMYSDKKQRKVKRA